VTYSVINDDCIHALKNFPDDHFESMVTDPPAGIAFMGKAWDKDKGGRDHWITWMTGVMKECHRVMKPGAHGFVWALPRTSHWTATALEDAGFEIRDSVHHLFGSGFPKSHNISKGLDKKAGAEREVIGKHIQSKQGRKPGNSLEGSYASIAWQYDLTANKTPEAKQWDGWGTALKPAHEIWWLIRKPLEEKTVARNVLKHGTGGINVDACRGGLEGFGSGGGLKVGSGKGFAENASGIKTNAKVMPANPKGRFPANQIVSGEAREELDAQSGVSKSGRKRRGQYGGGVFAGGLKSDENEHHDSGGASRFFYCAKAAKSERGENNNHPTVKAQKLMRYLCKMITPPKGTVLDPFTGSGSTGVAALKEGFNFQGIEKEKEYADIAIARLKNVPT